MSYTSNPYSHLKFESPKRAVWFATKDSVLLDLSKRLSSNESKRKALRPESKRQLEYRQAALFTLARASLAHDPTMVFAMAEQQHDSVDCVLRTGDKTYHYETVQLKEIVPEDVNPKQTLEELLKRLALKYGSGERLTIAIHMNRNVTTVLDTFPQPNLRGISWWLFGIASQNTGFIVRNPFAEFEVTDFKIPKPPQSMTQW